MLAIKKLNNNAVLCRDGQGRDVIAMGRGVGFGGEFPRELPLSKIEHTFYDIDPKGQDVMRDLPSEIVMFTAKVMDIVATSCPMICRPRRHCSWRSPVICGGARAKGFSYCDASRL